MGQAMVTCCANKKPKAKDPKRMASQNSYKIPVPDVPPQPPSKLLIGEAEPKIKLELDAPSSHRTNVTLPKDDLSCSFESSRMTAVLSNLDGEIPASSLASVTQQAQKMIEFRRQYGITPESLAEEKDFVSKLIYNKTKLKTHYLDYKWALLYTKYLSNPKVKIKSIDNSKLLRDVFRTLQSPILITKQNQDQFLEPDLEKDNDYVLINESAWTFIKTVYGGGPEIKLEQPRHKITDFYVQQKVLIDDGAEFESAPLYTDMMLSELPITGLKNPKFQCFMNSVLQILVSTPEFVSYFMCNEFPRQRKLCSSIQEFLCAVQQSRHGGVVSAQRYMSHFYKKFQAWQQHDSQEFFLYLLCQLRDELQSKDETDFHSTFPSNQVSLIIQPSEKSNFVEEYFQGEIKGTLICVGCKTEIFNKETFLDLSLSMIKTTNKIQSLHDCLKSFFEGEVLDDPWVCDNCTLRQQKVRKTQQISLLPKILIIHLKRFTHYPKKLKIRDPISYPLNLDMLQFCDPSITQGTYLLRGIIQHQGVIDSGHYTAATRRGMKWFLFDDEQVILLQNQSQLKLDQAYQLIYEFH